MQTNTSNSKRRLQCLGNDVVCDDSYTGIGKKKPIDMSTDIVTTDDLDNIFENINFVEPIAG